MEKRSSPTFVTRVRFPVFSVFPPSTKTNSRNSNSMDVERLNKSPWLGRPGDHFLRLSMLNKLSLLLEDKTGLPIKVRTDSSG